MCKAFGQSFYFDPRGFNTVSTAGSPAWLVKEVKAKAKAKPKAKSKSKAKAKAKAATGAALPAVAEEPCEGEEEKEEQAGQAAAQGTETAAAIPDPVEPTTEPAGKDTDHNDEPNTLLVKDRTSRWLFQHPRFPKQKKGIDITVKHYYLISNPKFYGKHCRLTRGPFKEVLTKEKVEQAAAKQKDAEKAQDNGVMTEEAAKQLPSAPNGGAADREQAALEAARAKRGAHLLK